MKPPRRSLFLAPESYRRKRLMDGARMVPVAGAFLVLLPMLWRVGPGGHSTAIEGIYLFAVWAVLIVVARLLSRPLLVAADGEAGPATSRDGETAPGQDEPR